MEIEQKYSIFQTKWGFFGLLADSKGLLKATLPTNNRESAKTYLLVGMSKEVKEVKVIYPELTKAIIDYYSGIYVNFRMLKFALNWGGLTDFSMRVLTACRDIEIGQVVTYGQLAKKAGTPGASRAVGSVMANNKWPLIIGCHRVVRCDGAVGKFSGPGGSLTKKKMIEHEKQILINTGDNDGSDKENRIRKCTSGNWPLFPGDTRGKYGVLVRSDWT